MTRWPRVFRRAERLSPHRHAKSVCLNFGIAAQYKGTCNLRMTIRTPPESLNSSNPSRMTSLARLRLERPAVLRLRLFEALYHSPRPLSKGKAYVCDLNADEIRAYRGTLTEREGTAPTVTDPSRRNLDLFAKMRAGEFRGRQPRAACEDRHGIAQRTCVTPVIYRSSAPATTASATSGSLPHVRFAHCLSDSVEKITHSICTRS
jgi:glutaminyl-tRNA synthetase